MGYVGDNANGYALSRRKFMVLIEQLKSRLPWVRARVERQQFANTLELLRQDRLAEQYGLTGVKHRESAE